LTSPAPIESQLRYRAPAARLVLGYTAGLAIAVAGSWLRVALSGTLRIETSHWTFAVSSLVLGCGLALAAVCGWKLVKASEGLPARTLLRWAIPGHLVMALAAPITSTDFFQYLAYGFLDVAGKNPLAFGPTALGDNRVVHLLSDKWVAQPAVYGPVLLLLFRGVAFLGRFCGAPFWGSWICLKLLMGGCTLLATWLAARLLARDGGKDGALAMFVFSPLVAWELTGQGHSDAVLLVFIVGFVWAALQERTWLATFAITGATLAKLTMAPLLAIYLLFVFRRRPLRAIAAGFGALALSILLGIPYIRNFAGVGPFLSAVRGTRSHSLGDLLALALAPMGPVVQDAAVRATFGLCLAACAVIFAATIARSRTVPEMLRGCLLFLLAWDLTVPLFQTWYIVWLFPLALVDADRRWLRLVAVYASVSVLQWAVQLDPLTTVAIDGWVVWQAARLLRTGEETLGEAELAPPEAA
jgi:hypothetical protein